MAASPAAAHLAVSVPGASRRIRLVIRLPDQ